MSALSRRDFLKLSGLALAALALDRLRPATSAAEARAVLYRGSEHHPTVALTYDDGYLVKKLQELEEILAGYPEVRVTLFPVGEALLSNESKDPGIWKRYSENGHEIGYHSFDHSNRAVFSTRSALEDFDQWLEALRAVLGIEPLVRFARPPFGIVSQAFQEMCAARGLVATMWSTGWGGATETVMKTVYKVQNGDIVLLHTRSDDMETTRQALPYLAERGIRAVTLSELYLTLLKEQNESEGCYVDSSPSLTRTCIEP